MSVLRHQMNQFQPRSLALPVRSNRLHRHDRLRAVKMRRVARSLRWAPLATLNARLSFAALEPLQPSAPCFGRRGTSPKL